MNDWRNDASDPINSSENRRATGLGVAQPEPRQAEAVAEQEPARAKIVASGADQRLIFPNGRVIGFRDYGNPEGLPVFAFHGTPGSRLMFRLAEDYASANHLRLIAPERPGFGLSTPMKRRPLADWARDMAVLADCLGIKRFTVAGVSGGGPYAVACAAVLGEQVAALALVSPVGPFAGHGRPARIGPGHYLAFRVLPNVPLAFRGLFTIGRFGFRLIPQVMLGLIMARAAPSDWRILSRAESRRGLSEGVREGVRRGVGGAVEEMRIFARPWGLDFTAISAPTTLWQGTADRNVVPAAAFSLGAQIPGCMIHRLEGAGHYWILQHYPEVLDELARAARAAGMH